MAEAFLEILLEDINSLIKDEIGMIMNVDTEMNKLFSTLSTIQRVLEDAEVNQIGSAAVQNWLCKLNDITYEIDDTLDECRTQVALHMQTKLSNVNLVNVFRKLNMGRRIKKLVDNLDAIAAERTKFHLREMGVNKQKEIDASRETASTLSQSRRVYGRERDSEIIVDILVNTEEEEVSVLPVIGVGGLGKTTLAQLVFNNPRIVGHFEKRLWVSVPVSFDLKELVIALIESAGTSTSDLTRLDSLQRRLVELLSHKKYLIVLDDVWNEVQGKWSDLRNVLACGSPGSSIVVTTRVKMVADMMCTLRPYELMGLEDELCWRLLQDCAFGWNELGKFPNLEAIGKHIACKCAGVPLAARALGGLLRFKRTEDEWNYVLQSELWELPSSSEGGLIMPSLRLSYHHLPLHLRQCFAYCGVFPRHSEIEKDELVLMWMANGYISSHGALEVEDVAYRICDELVLRSLLQYTDPDDQTTLTMHDLVHDLAQSILESKLPGQTNVRAAASTDYRRIRQANLRKRFVAFPPRYHMDEMDISSVLTRFPRLRALDASGTHVAHLDSSVAHLRHLRQLNLSRNEIRSLPDSICSLWNLEVLNLSFCDKLVALPKKLRKLNNLRHLFLDYCDSLEKMPPKIRMLARLRTLSLFVVGHSTGNQLAELQSLNLGGRIAIRNLERVENPMDAKRANLSEKKRLHNLKLDWGSGGKASSLDEEVLEALEPHSNLQTLEIQGFRGTRFPVWLSSSSLDKLFAVTISDCNYCVHLPLLGDLPQLNFISLTQLPIRYIDEGDHQVQDGQFPSLVALKLQKLKHLQGFSKKQGMVLFPNLVELHIEDCSSFDLSPLSSLKKLQSLTCGSLTLASLPKVDSLATLEVHIVETMKCIPVETLQNLSGLRELKIFAASELSLPEEGLESLKSLTMLEISNLKETRVPESWLRHLSALEEIKIFDCSQVVELPEEGVKHLKFLKTVHLSKLERMVVLPKALQQLTSSLQQLHLGSLHDLESLPDWLDKLTSLHTLIIKNCPKISSIPDAMRGMSNLRILAIHRCPELQKRCRRESEDWHKISHIQYLDIGEED